MNMLRLLSKLISTWQRGTSAVVVSFESVEAQLAVVSFRGVALAVLEFSERIGRKSYHNQIGDTRRPRGNKPMGVLSPRADRITLAKTSQEFMLV